jgi:type II secretory pathway component GspD/PulD (secretin)
LAIEVERGSNALVIASSPRLFEAIERVVKEIDGGETVNDRAGEAAKGGVFEAGGAVTVIELAHTSPEQMKQMLEQLGASRGASDDRPGIVREPVVIQALATRRAIAVVAGPGDAEAIGSLVKTLDAEPLPAGGAEQVMVIVAREAGERAAVAATLRGMLNPAQASESPPARAIAEHLRRLTLQRPGAANGEGELSLDLTKPIRLLPDAQTNSIIVSSTAGNVASLRELVKSLDALPIGDAVVVRFFPLMNASCVRVKGVVDDLFRQGEELRRAARHRSPGLADDGDGASARGRDRGDAR